MPNHYLLDVPKDGGHSPVGGSVMHRVLACPGSVLASHGVPEREPGPWADEGSFAHLFAEMRLLRPLDATLREGWTHTDWPGQVVNTEMVYHIGRYVTYVSQIRNQLDGVLLVERKVDYTHLIRGGLGTGDVVVVGNGELHIIDLKYGTGEVVEAEDNDQLLTYAAAEVHRLELLYDFDKVVLHIVQPRREHFDKWETTVEVVHQHAQRIREVADLIVSDNPSFNPGEKQCKYCPASPCQAQIDQLAKDFATFDNEEQVQASMVASFLHVIERIPMYEKMFKIMQSKLEEELKQGKEYPQFKLVRGRAGTRAWAPELDEQEIVNVLTEFVPDPTALYTDPSLKSPAQVEKELRTSKEGKAALAKLVVQPEGRITFAPASDKRPAVKADDLVSELASMSDAAQDPLA
jgi:hypothetical protein